MMSEPAITLWSDRHYFSPYVFSVYYAALKEKGGTFSLQTLDIDGGKNLNPGWKGYDITYSGSAFFVKAGEKRLQDAKW